jgi:nitrilase
MSIVAAAVQAAPVVLDREATLAKLDRLAQEAADRGAQLVVFPEAFVSIYPASPVFGPVFGGFIDAAAGPAWQRLVESSVAIPGPAVDAIGRTARRTRTHLCVGANERTLTGTLHCALLLFGPDGELLQVRRKLVPTHDERMIWGPGPAQAPAAVATSLGRIGQLTCWENYMPLARLSLYQGGEQIHLAPTADSSDGWHASMQHIALEGRVFVVSANQYVTRADYPADFELREALQHAPEVLCRGGSAIFAPDGRCLAGPLYGQEGMLLAELDLGEVVRGKQLLDVAGHYSRPDVFRMVVGPDRER